MQMGEANHGKPNQITLDKLLFLDPRHWKNLVLPIV